MKYFLITAKHGHVGRNMYLPIVIPVSAETLEEAVKVARKKGGVKHHHLDWCLSIPQEITHEQFVKELERYRADPYFNKKTRQNLALFQDRLVPETKQREIYLKKDKAFFKERDVTYKVKREKEKRKRNHEE